VARFAPVERAALADLLLEVGPDAATLCDGWTTRDLAAHLVVRGTRPDVAGGIFIRTLSTPLRRVQASVAARPWSTLVAQARRRPVWALPGALDEAANRVEYYVHHEDVRRAQPGWEPRALPADLSAGLWAGVRSRAPRVLRRTPARVTVAAPGHGSIEAGLGGDPVELRGEPQELVLFLLGRQAHARVGLDGPAEVVDHMRHAHYGI
jgi:uncharacterized protein (TIGR03085 family)